MAELATTEDVESALGRSLTGDEIPKADGLLAVASAAVEDATGYRFAPGSYTVGREPHDGKVRLPAKVASVTSVVEVDQRTGGTATVTDYTLRKSTLYGLGDCQVEVTFTVTEAVPPVITELVAAIVAATLASPPVGAQSATAGPFQMSYVNTSGRVWFTQSDKLILRKYRQPKTAVRLL